MYIKKTQLYASLLNNHDKPCKEMDSSEYNDYILMLLDFVAKQDTIMTENSKEGHEEGVTEGIENNICRMVIEKVTVNPRYYANMSEILNKLIKKGNKVFLNTRRCLK